MEGQYIGIDMGGTNTRLGVVSKEGEVADLLCLSTREYSSWADFSTKLTSAISEMGLEGIEVLGIAVAGGVLIPEGIMSYSPHIRWLNQVPIKESLVKATGLPVFLENDANAVTYGEWMYGAGKGLSSVICLTLGSGVGGGIILNEELYRGEHGLGGEIGHMCVQPSGRLCTCGKRGCLEAYSSASALSAAYGERDLNGQADYEPDALQIYQRAVAGEKKALDLFTTFGEHLGIAIANLVNALSVHHYVITGGVSRAWGLFLGPLGKALEANLFTSHRGMVDVLRGHLGDKAGVMGVACLAADYL